MHSYRPQWPADRSDWKPPSPADFTYRDALDVAEFASIDALTTWYTYPHVWHLDKHGTWLVCRYDVTEGDAQAFIALRSSLARFGITLLDVVIINEEFQWWSLHELTSGTTAWNFEPSARVRVR